MTDMENDPTGLDASASPQSRLVSDYATPSRPRTVEDEAEAGDSAAADRPADAWADSGRDMAVPGGGLISGAVSGTRSPERGAEQESDAEQE